MDELLDNTPRIKKTSNKVHCHFKILIIFLCFLHQKSLQSCLLHCLADRAVLQKRLTRSAAANVPAREENNTTHSSVAHFALHLSLSWCGGATERRRIVGSLPPHLVQPAAELRCGGVFLSGRLLPRRGLHLRRSQEMLELCCPVSCNGEFFIFLEHQRLHSWFASLHCNRSLPRFLLQDCSSQSVALWRI